MKRAATGVDALERLVLLPESRSFKLHAHVTRERALVARLHSIATLLLRVVGALAVQRVLREVVDGRLAGVLARDNVPRDSSDAARQQRCASVDNSKGWMRLAEIHTPHYGMTTQPCSLVRHAHGVGSVAWVLKRRRHDAVTVAGAKMAGGAELSVGGGLPCAAASSSSE